MSSIGFPDGQKITQWLGAPIVQATTLVIGNVLHEDGPFNLASWASVIVAVKATGGNVTATVRQKINGGPAPLELDTTFVVPAGQTVFEAVVLFGDTVYLDLTGSAPGTSVDYALYPANTTTNAQVLASAVINVQHNDALVAAEATLDFLDAAGVMNFTVADDAPGTRVKVTPAWATNLFHPGTVRAWAGLGAQTSIGGGGPAGESAVVFGSAADSNIYRKAAGQLFTDGLFAVNGGQFYSINASASAVALGTVAAYTDAQYTFAMTRAGTMNWGAGGSSAPDANMYRSAAGVLKTDGQFNVGSAMVAEHTQAGQVAVGTATSVATITFGSAQDTSVARGGSTLLDIFRAARIRSTSATNYILFGYTEGDSFNRVQLRANGTIVMGDGTFDPSASGTAIYYTLDPNGVVKGVGLAPAVVIGDDTSLVTNGDTNMWSYFHTIGYRRFVLGANDSGGAGYRMLRVLN